MNDFVIVFYGMLGYYFILYILNCLVRKYFDLSEIEKEDIIEKITGFLFIIWIFTPLISPFACITGIFIMVLVYISLSVILG